MTYDDELPPWSIQPDEPSKSFNFFAEYRDSGPRRTILGLARVILLREEPEYAAMTKADQGRREHSLASTLYRESAEWDWVSRARAYDAYMDAEKVEAARVAHRDAVTTAQKNHVVLARWLTGLVGKGVSIAIDPKTDAQRKKIEKELEEMGLGAMIQHTRSAIDIERRVLGMDSLAEMQAAEQSEQRSASGQPALSLEEAKRIAKEAISELPPPPKPIHLPPPPDDEEDDVEPDASAEARSE